MKKRRHKTPRTDAAVMTNSFSPKGKELVYADIARSLEEDLYDAYQEIDRVRGLLEMALKPKRFTAQTSKKNKRK
jgi:hypothetical protein